MTSKASSTRTEECEVPAFGKLHEAIDCPKCAGGMLIYDGVTTFHRNEADSQFFVTQAHAQTTLTSSKARDDKIIPHCVERDGVSVHFVCSECAEDIHLILYGRGLDVPYARSMWRFSGDAN